MSKKQRIGSFTKFLMLSVALFFDILEFILEILLIGIIFNRIITILEYLIMWLWFKLKGVSFVGNPKISGRMGGTFILEMIPFLGSLPGFTFGVWSTIKQVGKEDSVAKSEKVVENQNIIRQKRG
jgi:hypothetical protein